MNHDAGASFTPRFSSRIAGLLALGWTAAVAIIFLFDYHAWLHPVALGQNLSAFHLGPHFSEFWLRRLGDAGWCLAVLTTAFPVGSLLISRLVRERTLLTGLFALGAGLWVMATGVLLIGLFATAKVGWVFGLAGCWLLPAPRAYFRKWVRQPSDGWMKLMLAFLVVAALLCLLGAVTPPFEYDELEYHLGAPSEYIKAGQIIFLPHNFYSNLPQLTEMLYLLGLVTRSDIATKMLHWCFGLLSAIAIYAVAGKLWSRRVGLTAAALFYCLPFVQDLSQTARIDLATTFFATLAFGGVLLAYDGNQWVRLAGLAGGMAVATKWTAIPVVVLPCVAGLLLARRFSFWFALAPLPWLFKNWFLTGNPIYPLGAVGPHWSAEQAALFAQKHYAHFDTAGLAQFVERIWQYSFLENGALPALLMTAPLVVLIRDNGRLRRAVGLFVLAYLGWYALTFRPWRFLFPVFPLAAALGACALDSVGKWSRGIVVVVWLTGLAWMGLMVDGRLALGQVTETEFVGSIYEPVVWMNENLPAQARVLYVGEARTHHARHAVVWATAFDQFPADWTNGVTHVYVNLSELSRLHDHYGYPRGLDLAVVQRHCGRELHRGVFEWTP
ncbi:MAG: glycosyltransferase family 39 protein [Verrucomicrobiota bacterium]